MSFEEKERARCLQVCRDYARACYCEAEKRAQVGLHDDAKEFTERGKAVENLVAEIENVVAEIEAERVEVARPISTGHHRKVTK